MRAEGRTSGEKILGWLLGAAAVEFVLLAVSGGTCTSFTGLRRPGSAVAPRCGGRSDRGLAAVHPPQPVTRHDPHRYRDRRGRVDPGLRRFVDSTPPPAHDGGRGRHWGNGLVRLLQRVPAALGPTGPAGDHAGQRPARCPRCVRAQVEEVFVGGATPSRAAPIGGVGLCPRGSGARAACRPGPWWRSSVFEGDDLWNSLQIPPGERFGWDAAWRLRQPVRAVRARQAVRQVPSGLSRRDEPDGHTGLGS